MKRILIPLSILAALFFGGFGAGHLLRGGTLRVAAADDAYRTSTLVLTSNDFGFGDGAEEVFAATISSTDTDDAKAKMDAYVHVPESEGWEDVSGGEFNRTQSGLSGSILLTTGSYPSGTVFKVVYTCLGSNGSPRFTYQRTVTKE